MIERLPGNSAQLNEHGQYAYYGKERSLCEAGCRLDFASPDYR